MTTKGLTYAGTLIQAKDKVAREARRESCYALVSTKVATHADEA